MVKPTFDNIEIDVWVDDRKLGLAQPSLCVFHEVQSMGGQFLEALRELNEGPIPGRRTLTFAPCARKKPVTQLKLWVVVPSDELMVMNVSCEGAIATVKTTIIGLQLLVDAFTSWLNGREDFGVSPRHSSLTSARLGKQDRESGELWFWGPGYVGP